MQRADKANPVCWCDHRNTAVARAVLPLGRHWKWLKPNESIVPLGKVGEFDTCGVFGKRKPASCRPI